MCFSRRRSSSQASSRSSTRRIVPWTLAVILSLQGCGLSQRAGEDATSGAIKELRKEVQDVPPEEQGLIARRNGKAAVRGLLDELSSPESRRQLSNTINLATNEVLQGMEGRSSTGEGWGGSGAPPPMEDFGRQLAKGISTEMTLWMREELGPDGQGPLAVAMARTSERVSVSAMTAIEQELGTFMGPCTDTDRRKCVNQRARELGAAAAIGALDVFRVPVLVSMFVLGFGACLVLMPLLLRLGRSRSVRRR